MEKTIGVFIETVGSLFDKNLKDPDKKKGGGEDNIDYSQIITILNKKNKLPHPHPCTPAVVLHRKMLKKELIRVNNYHSIQN